MSLYVESMVVDGSKRETLLAPVVLDVGTANLTAREIIRIAVERQVEALNVRGASSAQAQEARRLLNRQYLASVDTRHDTSRAREPRTPPLIDVGHEVARAHEAFKDGVFIIMAGGKQVTRLDERVALPLNGKVTFLRLTPLVGG